MVTTSPIRRASAQKLGAEEGDDSSRQSIWQRRVQRLKSHFSTFSAIYLCGFFLFCIDTPMFMIESSKLRALEAGVCREYYRHVGNAIILPDGSIPENLCKVHEIQQSLAKLRGVQGFLEEIPGLFLAIPYGILADARGGKVTIILAMFGVALSESWVLTVLLFPNVFPVRATWFSPLFRILGGGIPVIVGSCWAMFAGFSPPNLRTRIFFYIGIVQMATQLVGPMVGLLLMETVGPYITYFLGIWLQVLGLPILLLLPSTIAKNEQVLENDLDAPIAISPEWNLTNIREQFNGLLVHFKDSVFPLLRPTIIIGLLAMFVNCLVQPILQILMQYMSVKFHWPISQTSYIISIRAIVQIAILVAVLPYLHHIFTKRVAIPATADLYVARTSVTFLITGALAMGLAAYAPSFMIALIVFSVGSGFTQAMRSFMTSLVPQHEIGLLYTVMAIFDSIGALTATPLLAYSFSYGISKGGMLIGLPFFIVAGMYCISGVSVWCLNARLENESCHDSGEEEALLGAG
ncbi:hypothetical protein Vi05172_g7742 [Venturia inaequalis]|nr:hypothetical protein Vi05172_g7742 [Venturia inaequalis]